MAECPHGSRQLTNEGDSNRNGDVDDAAAAVGGKSTQQGGARHFAAKFDFRVPASVLLRPSGFLSQ
jgi:hypothetical protein